MHVICLQDLLQICTSALSFTDLEVNKGGFSLITVNYSLQEHVSNNINTKYIIKLCVS